MVKLNLPIKTGNGSKDAFAQLKNRLGREQDQPTQPTQPLQTEKRAFVDPFKKQAEPKEKMLLPEAKQALLETPMTVQAKPALEDYTPKQIPFDAPEEEQANALKQALTVLEGNIRNADAVRQNTAYVISLCRRHPQLAKMMQPEDYGLMVRALGNIMQHATFKSNAKTRKKSETASVRETRTSSAADAVASIFGKD